LEKYDDENYCNVKKIKSTKQKRYNDENYSNTDKAIVTKKSKSAKEKKILSNNLSKNKLEHVNSKRENLDNFNIDFLRENFIKDNKFLFKEAVEYFNIPESTMNGLKKKLNINESNKLDTLYIEDRINKIFNDSFIVRTKDIIAPLELDLYSKENNFAIEYNGLIWHSHGISKHDMFNNPIEEPNKHINKTILAENKGIQLYHIFENEWLDKNKKAIWISMIRDKQGLNTKIGARKCTIKEVPTKEARKFIDENHMQGYSNAKIKIGLYYRDILVSIMTFGKPRFNKNIEYELIRFCTKKNITIQGGGSRLLSYFEKEYKPKSLLSYANRRWSTGSFYEVTGFDFRYDSKPNFFYFIPGENKLYSRNMFQKHKLESVLETYDKELTQMENIYSNSYRKIFDCGNKVYIKTYK